MKWRSAVAVALFAFACRTATAPPVAGLPRNFGVVEEGKIYRGSQPNADEMENLYRHGVRTVVKLNLTDIEQERSETSEYGIRLMEFPLSAWTVGTSKSCEMVERAYEAMSNPLNWPVYVHCDHGRDRTGFLVGLFRERVEGWTFAQVSDELARYGHDRKMRLLFPSIAHALADHFHACAAAR